MFDHDAPLRFEALRQVGIGIQRDAVGPQLRDLSHGAGKGLRRLLGQAVDQVAIDRLEADASRRSHQAAHLLEGLDAVHCQQGLGVFGRAEGIDEAVGRGVGGVARPGPVEPAQHGLGQHRHWIGSVGLHGARLCQSVD